MIKRAVNFPINEKDNPVCPNGKEIHYLYSRSVKGNKYGRTEDFYQCEDCADCSHKQKCCNRVIRLNEELTSFHKGVLNNLNSAHGALLRMKEAYKQRVHLARSSGTKHTKEYAEEG